MKRAASIYSLFMGISMILMWIMFYFTGGIPEIKTKPLEFSMHLSAEILTAFLLICGGIGLLTNKKWSFKVYLISMGMLLYTIIMSPGYFLQRDEIPFVIMFSVFLIVSIIFIMWAIRDNSEIFSCNK